MSHPARMAQCCTRTPWRLAIHLPRWHQAYEPILSQPFWLVRNTRPRQHAFHASRLQKAAVGNSTSLQSSNNGQAASAAATPATIEEVTETSRSHDSRSSSHLQQHQQQQQDGGNLVDKIEMFLDRSGRRRPQQPPALSALTKAPLRLKSENKRNRYEAAFQPGDFMCPRCGTHNFGDPDKHLRPFLARSIPRATHSHGPQPQNKLPQTDLKEQQGQGKDSSPVRQPLRTRERRKRVQGASSTCIECGYSAHRVTAEETESTATTSTESTSTSKVDLRISRPREFVCDYCDTVNFAGRISCVGCGALMPVLRDSELDQQNK